ncbi:hypothetical protein MSS2_02483 [Mycobacterium marinum]|uniref:hypothetical protein n=1 Tax=Mycobacterium marinum TaxID=1781 RepID=UPI000E3D496B|nr:hypothetical protein [Mycobacterium marinum]RFZ54919.1 hypothetical protein MSS2_02483 [Mycobacterium marinum]RFZ67495.1 hypothetical protein DE4576_02008 [Mycobacterium marinum]
MGNSGFGNAGDDVSGFLNTVGGGTENHFMSGIGNTATGGSDLNGLGSGFFDTGVTGPIGQNPSGLVSGFNSGLFNVGTAVSGLFTLTRLVP